MRSSLCVPRMFSRTDCSQAMVKMREPLSPLGDATTFFCHAWRVYFDELALRRLRVRLQQRRVPRTLAVPSSRARHRLFLPRQPVLIALISDRDTSVLPQMRTVFCNTVFVTMNASSVDGPPSRPIPLSFTPPKGVSASGVPKWLMDKTPHSSSRLIRSAS